jgi:hypothetical protein
MESKTLGRGGMQAGFPVCASDDQPKQNLNLFRLPECALPKATN